jgi:hypothetical protein
VEDATNLAVKNNKTINADANSQLSKTLEITFAFCKLLMKKAYNLSNKIVVLFQYLLIKKISIKQKNMKIKSYAYFRKEVLPIKDNRCGILVSEIFWICVMTPS